jgi:hypothetical protein
MLKSDDKLIHYFPQRFVKLNDFPLQDRLLTLMSLDVKLLSSYIAITIINVIYMIHVEEIMLGKSMSYHNQNFMKLLH